MQCRVYPSPLLAPPLLSRQRCRIRRISIGASRSDVEGPSLVEWTPLLLATAAVLGYHFGHPNGVLADEASTSLHQAPQELYRLAENEDFWSNMARYSRFFVSVMAGTAYTMLKPFGRLLKNPITAAVIVGSGVLLYLFISSTLKAMLGLDDPELEL